MNLGDSIRHGAKWVLGGNIAGQVLQFTAGVVLARLLLPSDFGMLVTIQIYTGLVGFVAGGGMGQALIRAKEAKLADFQIVFTIQLAIGILIYALFFFAAPPFARWYDTPLYSDLLRVSALSFVLRPFTNVPSAWLIREMRFRQRVTIDLLLAPLVYAVSIGLALQDFGVWSLVISGIVSMLLTIVAMLVVTPFRPAIRFDRRLAKELATYSFKVTSNDLISYIRTQTPNFLLGRITDLTTVGLFNKADSLYRIPFVISTSTYDSLFRGLAKIRDDGNMSRYIYLRTITLLSVYMVPVFVGLGWLAHPFIAFVYGAQWLGVATPLSILCIGGIFVCIGHPSGAVMAAHNRLGREMVVQVINAGVVALGCVIGIRWGLDGVAWAMLIALAYGTMHLGWLARQCLSASLWDLLRALFPGLLLNGMLLCVLFILDVWGFDNVRGDSPLVYLVSMSAIGAASYVAAFLYLPIPALASESTRWKKLLRLM